MTATPEPKRITGKKVLLWMVAFFGVIIGANASLTYFALNTWPRLTTEDAYKKGLAYNQTLDAAARQSAMGWVSTVDIHPGTGTDKTIKINLTGAGDTPQSGLVVTATLERAVGTPGTQIITLTETAPGTYAGTFKSPAEGRWLTEVNAVGPNDANYRMKHQVMIKP